MLKHLYIERFSRRWFRFADELYAISWLKEINENMKGKKITTTERILHIDSSIMLLIELEMFVLHHIVAFNVLRYRIAHSLYTYQVFFCSIRSVPLNVAQLKRYAAFMYMFYPFVQISPDSFLEFTTMVPDECQYTFAWYAQCSHFWIQRVEQHLLWNEKKIYTQN